MLAPDSIAEAVIPIWVPALLVVMLLAAGGVFWALVWRWTKQRAWMALSEWADANGFALRRGRGAQQPAVLARLGETVSGPALSLHSATSTVLQTQLRSAGGSDELRWNLLIRRLAFDWPTTALRPISRDRSIVDCLPRDAVRTYATGERFSVCAEQRRWARLLEASAMPGLLPADVGLLLIGRELILDFSTRPFDTLELERMAALAEQLVSHLPQPMPIPGDRSAAPSKQKGS